MEILNQMPECILDAFDYDPMLRKISVKLSNDLIKAQGEMSGHIKGLPNCIIKALGKALEHYHTPLNTITSVIDSWDYPNFMDPFEIMGIILLHEVKDSKYLTNKASMQIELLREKTARKIIKMYKELDP